MTLCHDFHDINSPNGTPDFWSAQVALRWLLLCAILQPELQDCTLRTTVVLKKLRLSSRSCVCVLRLHLKLRFLSRKAAADQARSSPRPRDSESRRADHATTSKDQFASNKFARRHSESASTRTILAEGRASIFRIEENPQVLHIDHADPRKGFLECQTSVF